MLEVKDIQKLFTHLREVHPNCPPDKIPRLTTGLAKMWAGTFAGYSYQQVEDAADRRAAESRFWPDASEIKAYLPKLPKRVERGRELDGSTLEAVKWVADVRADYHRRLKGAGLPTLAEARAQGMTCAKWVGLTEAVELLPPQAGRGAMSHGVHERRAEPQSALQASRAGIHGVRRHDKRAV